MIERKLTVSEVSINQVAVEIRVLKIGNRQVTLAVFKQLREENIINFDTGELKGVPWGWVNYHPDCTNGYVGHRHIIWQKENELRRATVESSLPRKGLIYKLENDIDTYAVRFVAARILEGWIPTMSSSGETPRLYSPLNVTFRGSDKSYTVEVYLSDTLCDAWYRACRWKEDACKWDEDDFWSLRNKDKIVNAYFSDSPSYDSQVIADEYVLPLLREYHSLLGVYLQSCDQLAALEQLFIAV